MAAVAIAKPCCDSKNTFPIHSQMQETLMKRFATESPLSFDQPAARMFMWPFEMMLRFQANIARSVQDSTVGWAQRRQEAADDAMETFDRLIHSRDLGEAVTIQQKWLDNSIRRLDEDFNWFASEGSKLAHKATATARQTVGQSSDAMRDTARRAEDSVESMGRGLEEAADSASRETKHNGKQSKSREHHRRAV